MVRYLLGRLVAMVVTLFIIMTLCFFIIRLMPMNIFDNPELPPFVVEMLEAKMHLDKPIYVQYFYYLKGIVTEFDFGTSVKVRQSLPVFEVIAERIPVTLKLNIVALIISVPIGIVTGTVAALKKNKAADHIISFLVVLCISIPSFVFGALLQYVFTHKFKLFPTLYDPAAVTFFAFLKSVTLPVIALALGPIATITRYLRGELIETMSSEYLLLARTKGLTRTQAIVRHAFRNSCVPLVNVIIPQFTGILIGSLVIENIYGIPGMGGMLVKSINAGDHPLTIALLMFYSFISLVTILIMDILYGILDPRIRIGGKK